ncbi:MULTISPECIES: polysaccharide lyase family 8 super-sandwich domain-containing protein [Pseudomonas]|uniref:Chondroitin AC lyase n=1 Tax=Pseudomonas quercus TaxID=2722792 RepID=A0ABX0YF08_9PSED|nr:MULTISPECIES: polysaccharide lyase family 8 super-sandwich domain-containing protein [Pseudomonas]MBF7143928.1 hypothetical protein [Pseudomonas sp. LY10J]NJP01993.1 hypothetical protein [Pseudomonas quercus]
MTNSPDEQALKKDAAAVFERLQAMLVDVPSTADASAWLAKVSSDGSFTDIAYPSQTPVADVGPWENHLDRVRGLASFAIKGAEEKQKAGYRAAAAKALVWYTQCDVQTKNWWQREIGLAKRAGHALVVLAAAGSNDVPVETVHYLEKVSNINPGTRHMTGANLADLADNQLMWAFGGWKVSSNVNYLKKAHDASVALSKLYRPVTLNGPEQGEGIRVDGSFSQHNPVQGDTVYSQLYTGGYGVVFLDVFFKYSALLRGAYALARECNTHVFEFVKKGLAGAYYKGRYDPHSLGRGISRPQAERFNTPQWLIWCKEHQYLINTGGLEGFKESKVRIEGLLFDQINAYWLNDSLTAKFEGFAFFNKVVSTRTVGTETGNGENLKGYYLGCGTYFLVAEGHEYHNIQPLLDWQRLPGLTAEYDPNFSFPLLEWGKNAWGSHDFAGVLETRTVLDKKDFYRRHKVSCGVSTLQLTKGNLQDTRKTIIVHQGSVCCLGHAGNLRKTTHPVYTTVNQCLFVDEVTIIAKGKMHKISTGISKFEETECIFHDGLTYDFRNDNLPTITIAIEERKENWRTINTSVSDCEKNAKILTIHTEHKLGSEEYFWRISSILDAPSHSLSYLESNHRKQIIRLTYDFTPEPKDVVAGSIFYSFEILRIPDWPTLKFSSPCIFMMIQDTLSYPKKIIIVVSDPTQKLESLTIYVTGSGIEKTLTAHFPEGEKRGKGVVVSSPL